MFAVSSLHAPLVADEPGRRRQGVALWEAVARGLSRRTCWITFAEVAVAPVNPYFQPGFSHPACVLLYRVGFIPLSFRCLAFDILNECLPLVGPLWHWSRPDPCCGKWHVGDNYDTI